MIIRVVELTNEEKIQIQTIIKKGKDWRERERAETIWLLSEGQTVFDVAKKQGVIPETIRERRRRWYKKGMASLADQVRSGAPCKLNDEHRESLKGWMDEEAQDSRTLYTRLKETYPTLLLCTATLRNECKRLGYVWKRTRYSLKKKRDEQRFKQAERDIAELIAQAQAGEIELAYVDEAGFAPQPPNRSAWTKSGETHAVTATRGQRLNVIGALLSSGELLMTKLWHSVTGLWFFAFLMAVLKRVKKPLVVILDNASIHTAKKYQPYWDLLTEAGMRFYFLPPYSPELNRIEMLWRKMKYQWLPFKSFTPSELEQAIESIGTGFGSEYTLTFC